MASVSRRIRRNLASRLAFRDIVSAYDRSNCPPRFFGDIYRRHRHAVVRELVNENTAAQIEAVLGNPKYRGPRTALQCALSILRNREKHGTITYFSSRAASA